MIKGKLKKKETGIVIEQDTLENQAKRAYLSIGTNLGNRNLNIEKAKLKLTEYKIKIVKCSSNYITKSWPNPNNPYFINVVLEIKTFLKPNDLMNVCLNIERDLGRKRNKKNAPRICDIDIIDYDQKIINNLNGDNLQIPHSKMHTRNFVLLPLFEISKKWVHPVKKKDIKKLINSLKTNHLRAIKLV